MPAQRNKDDKNHSSSSEATRKVYCDEALGHLKGGNYNKALVAYNKVGGRRYSDK